MRGRCASTSWASSGGSLHHPIEMQNYLFDLLMEAGRAHGLRPFGVRAMDSLRIEKSYRLIPRELSIEYAALESGLHRFVHLKQGVVPRPGRPGRVAAEGLFLEASRPSKCTG